MSRYTTFGWFNNHPILSSALFILLFSLITNTFSQPQYYNYNTNGTNNSFPLGIAAGKNAQWLLLAGDLASPTPAPAGNITKFWFRVGDTYPINATYTTFEIKLGQAAITALPAGSYYTPMTTVFTRASFPLVAAGGTWVEITLDTPFPYDPAQALIVEMGHCAGAGATGFPMCTTTLTGNRRNWSVGGCPFVYSNVSTSTLNCGVTISTAPPVCSFAITSQTSGTTSLLQAVSTVNNLIGWAAGAAATVRKTTDGGTTWTNANPNPGVINGDIYNMFAIDANNCLLTTSPGATFIYRTTNGGTNWVQVFTQAGGFMDAIVMKDANTGFAYGDPVSLRWSLWKTTNGGANWDSTGLYIPQNASEAGWNNAMKIVGNNIWFGTNGTRVYYSTNLGANWLFGATTGSANSYCLQFNSATNGLAGGSAMLKTTNGGANYTAVTVPGTGNITALGGGAGTFYWCTRGANIYRTEDFGANWITAFTGVVANALWGLDMQTVNGCPRGWAVGANGTIVKLGNDTLVAVGNNNNQLPNVYSLSQNYPNPFNPSTTISFDLPLSGITTLVVFDLLGREITTLVNDFKPSGNYRVSFDGSNLSSGVYFYTLKSGDFVESKKMLLIK